jgi:NADPH-dependent 2,4-dienoyl-CoA reductase/sulfur reductase-like enzyme
VDAVDGSSVTLAGQIQCRDTARWGVQREFNRRIVDRFTERGIEIANPQRNFVIVKGGDAGELAAAVERDQPRDSSGDAHDGAKANNADADAGQRGERTITGEPSNLPPERSKPSRP